MQKYLSVIAISVLLAVPLVSLAAEYRFSENPSVNADETIADDVYLGGGNVSSAGAIEGDLWIGGGSVVVNSAVSADLTAAGGNLSVLGAVGDDARVAGGNLLIQSRVGDDLHAAGGQVTVAGEGVGGDATIGGGMVRLDAPVTGDVMVGGGNVYLNSTVDGDVVVDAETLTLGSEANIAGSLLYTASSELTQEDGAVVTGETVFNERTPSARPEPETVMAAGASAVILGQFLALLVSALLLGLIFNRFAVTLVQKATNRPFSSLGLGLVLLAALPVISVLLLMTLIGIPLGILGLISFVALMLVGWILVPIVLGSLLSNYFFKTGTAVTWKTILLGAVVYSLLGLVPLLGWLVQILALFMTLGAIVVVKWEVAREWL